MIKAMTDAQPYDGYRNYTAEVASNYEQDRQVEAHWWKEDAFVQEYFRDRPAPRLLDIPVGTGRFLPHYKRAQSVVGVDVSEDMLIEARRKLPLLPAGAEGSVERGDVFALRFDDHAFTHAVVWRLFHLIPPALVAGAIAELCRVTDGEIVVQTYVAQTSAAVPRASYSARLARGLRRVARALEARVSSAVSARPAAATSSADVPPAAATPWSHIQSYSHAQSEIDAQFLSHGFAARTTRHLDTYDNCDVRVTVYQR
jgi:ubiquinone/menaquinone biosynthesis C-methylase UbiE